MTTDIHNYWRRLLDRGFVVKGLVNISQKISVNTDTSNKEEVLWIQERLSVVKIFFNHKI